MLELNRIYNEPNRLTLSRMPDGFIDLTVTSPPYKDEDGYTDRLIMLVSAELYRVHKANSLCFVNFGHLAGHKRRFMRVGEIFEMAGWNLLDTITWKKKQFSPIQGNRRVNNISEFIHVLWKKPENITDYVSGYVMILTKGKGPLLNRLRVGVPYIDPSNARRFSGGKNLRCQGNVVEIGYETIQSKSQKRHNDLFPLELVEYCIDLTGYRPCVAYDPFAGSGTAPQVFRDRGIPFIGSEINQDHCETARSLFGLEYKK